MINILPIYVYLTMALIKVNISEKLLGKKC